ncbi:MAG: hypothetical protein ABIE14_00530, partial [Patescibacteria group bacterium]
MPSFLSSSLRRVGAFVTAFALLIQLSPFGTLPVAMANDTTTIVEWNFPDDSADAIADVGIEGNLTKTISTNATGALAFNGECSATTNAAVVTGWDGGSGARYWQIEFTTAGYSDLTLSSKQLGSNAGPKDFKVRYKIGAGGIWTDVAIPSGKIDVNNSWSIDGTGSLSNVSLPAACDNKSSVYLQWIMTSNEAVGANSALGSGGTNRIDDIVIAAAGTIDGEITSYDFGDAPDSGGNYPTLFENDGA